ncbi:hypothetical protein SAMN05421774_101361 [Gemmobacter megaterium]|uniref:Lipoprotein n=1 Tax=Gemmobacter megaterium TaxID=1086013 RepID=A0A1N7KDY3_9RHOB|nr:hypothetical protein [Gemmobacter megaterium]GGE01563.1 hypothetical protein GCM10011345_03530 [Gemmobacter megaterium]SIS59680.1 hypothetical protein SAMN05421774_101361 [Gemmobacter megaterium]
MMARGAMLVGMCGAMGLAGCAGSAVPDSATGTSSALATEAVAVARLCLDQGLAPAPVVQGLQVRGYVARVPLSPVLSPADTELRLGILPQSPCTIHVERTYAKLVARAMENELRGQGFGKTDTRNVWTDGPRRIRMERSTIRTARYVENNVAISLSPG